MSLLDQLSGVLGNLTGGNLSEQETHAHYDQVANTVPRDQLGRAIGPALSQLGTQDVQQQVTNSAAQMSSQQRGGIVQQLLGSLGGSGTGSLGGSGLGGLGAMLGQLGINQGVANDPQSASPEEVGVLAAHAKENNPSVFHEAMSVYAAHPTLVKALGTLAIAQIANHLTTNRS